MQSEEICSFIDKNKICFLATSDGEQVHVRGMRVFLADDKGLLLKVLAYKPVYQQMRDHPQVELCFFDEQEYRQLRLNGNVVEIDDTTLRDQVAAECPTASAISANTASRCSSSSAYRRHPARSGLVTRSARTSNSELVDIASVDPRCGRRDKL